MKRFAVSFYRSCLIVLVLGTAAFATAGASDFPAGMKLASTCGIHASD